MTHNKFKDNRRKHWHVLLNEANLNLNYKFRIRHCIFIIFLAAINLKQAINEGMYDNLKQLTKHYFYSLLSQNYWSSFIKYWVSRINLKHLLEIKEGKRYHKHLFHLQRMVIYCLQETKALNYITLTFLIWDSGCFLRILWWNWKVIIKKWILIEIIVSDELTWICVYSAVEVISPFL